MVFCHVLARFVAAHMLLEPGHRGLHALTYIVGPANSDSKLKQLERQGLGATPVA